MPRPQGLFLLGVTIALVIVAGALAFGFTGLAIDPPSGNPPDDPSPGTPDDPPMTEPEEPQTPEPGMRTFAIRADDDSFDPPMITVNRGDLVTITFMVSSTNVAFDGLDFRSQEFSTGPTDPGSSATVEFTAEESFDISSYWPNSSFKKTDMTVVVND